jgi:hypothetical protein
VLVLIGKNPASLAADDLIDSLGRECFQDSIAAAANVIISGA